MGRLAQGFSPAAGFLANAERAARKRFRQSTTFSKQSAYDQLGEVYNACRKANWDGEGADAIEQGALRDA